MHCVPALEQLLFFDEFERPRKQCHKALFRCWNIILNMYIKKKMLRECAQTFVFFFGFSHQKMAFFP
ncbi:hypothetical protein TSAR_016752 [Trichomalopsis sarcophagae]|uniref:Uncharacterized protein n=1 Tax=Trichomalopsis sarcophagae TaxID=543379 RepID=A0A232FMN8_9HYME|nr:hypothetical protein TSAR_016752 [Trichomalopsis sarcophagae]